MIFYLGNYGYNFELIKSRFYSSTFSHSIVSQGSEGLAHSLVLVVTRSHLNAKPEEVEFPSCSKRVRTELRYLATRWYSIHLSSRWNHNDAANHRNTTDTLFTNCTFGKRTTAAVQGKNIRFQSAAVRCLALNLAQRSLRNGLFLSDSRAVNVLCS